LNGTLISLGFRLEKLSFLIYYFYQPFDKKDEKSAEMDSQIRQNYERDCEAMINKMINLELYASYTYTSMVSFKLKTFF